MDTFHALRRAYRTRTRTWRSRVWVVRGTINAFLFIPVLTSVLISGAVLRNVSTHHTHRAAGVDAFSWFCHTCCHAKHSTFPRHTAFTCAPFFAARTVLVADRGWDDKTHLPRAARYSAREPLPASFGRGDKHVVTAHHLSGVTPRDAESYHFICRAYRYKFSRDVRRTPPPHAHRHASVLTFLAHSILDTSHRAPYRALRHAAFTLYARAYSRCTPHCRSTHAMPV